jgi:hypothetical protein
MSPPPPRVPQTDSGRNGTASVDRASRLAAMTTDASTLALDRKERLQNLLEKEKAELDAEERARARSKGTGEFLSSEQKKVFGGTGGLEDRLRSRRGALVRDTD